MWQCNVTMKGSTEFARSLRTRLLLSMMQCIDIVGSHQRSFGTHLSGASEANEPGNEVGRNQVYARRCWLSGPPPERSDGLRPIVAS